MHGLRLPAHIHYGLSGGERIFLDLETDCYFQLPVEEERLFEAMEQERFVPASGCAALTRAGLLSYSPGGRPIRPTDHIQPVRSLIEQPSRPLGFALAEILEISLDLIAARWMIHRRKLTMLYAARSAAGPPGSTRTLQPCVEQFRATRKFVPLAPNCLSDSIALRRYLGRRGIGTTLVIGAKLHPFAAHCWLQHGDTVLNDSLSGARGFSPILIL